eukprot:NODE_78_length_23230_cov_1.644979.p3 type:complete len:765 gc:universal NODE_78_length_23230_cov_1.644979:11105-8811(-)
MRPLGEFVTPTGLTLRICLKQFFEKMKRAIHSPESLKRKPAQFTGFYEWVQEVICLNNGEWCEQHENTTKFTTELIQYQKSSCKQYNITNLQSIKDIISIILKQDNSEHNNRLTTTLQLCDDVLTRNQLNQSLQQEYSYFFNILFKKKWVYQVPSYCTPLTSSNRYIDLVFNHGWNIILYIKSLYDMETNKNSRILFGFVACVLQNMFEVVHWSNTPTEVEKLLKFSPEDSKQVLKYREIDYVLAVMFTKWNIKLAYMDQFKSEWTRLIPAINEHLKSFSSLGHLSWYGDALDVAYTEEVQRFQQHINQLYLNADDLGFDIPSKPKRISYEPAPNVLQFMKTKEMRSKPSFAESQAYNINGFKNKKHSNMQLRKFRQILASGALVFDVTDFEDYFQEFMQTLEYKSSEFKASHDLTSDFPVNGFLSTILNHLKNSCQVPLTDVPEKFMEIISAVFFDLWHFAETGSSLFFNAAYEIWGVHNIEVVFVYNLMQTKDFYEHPPKSVTQSDIEYHKCRVPDALPLIVENLLQDMLKDLLLRIIWTEPEIFNLCALIYQSRFDSGSDGDRARAIIKDGKYHEAEIYYEHIQAVYELHRSLLFTRIDFSEAKDYIPSHYFNFDQFIMFVFVYVIDTSLGMVELMMENINSDHWKTTCRRSVADKGKKFIACAILKEDRFRMLDFRDINVIIMCGLFALCKYLDIRIQLAEFIGALQTSTSNFESEILYSIYDKTLTNGDKRYCDIVSFFNTHFVPTFGSLVRHFARTVI